MEDKTTESAGSSMARMVAVEVSKAGYEHETEILERAYHLAQKECLGRLLPIQHEGKLLALGDLWDQLATGRPHSP